MNKLPLPVLVFIDKHNIMYIFESITTPKPLLQTNKCQILIRIKKLVLNLKEVLWCVSFGRASAVRTKRLSTTINDYWTVLMSIIFYFQVSIIVKCLNYEIWSENYCGAKI